MTPIILWYANPLDSYPFAFLFYATSNPLFFILKTALRFIQLYGHTETAFYLFNCQLLLIWSPLFEELLRLGHCDLSPTPNRDPVSRSTTTVLITQSIKKEKQSICYINSQCRLTLNIYTASKTCLGILNFYSFSWICM